MFKLQVCSLQLENKIQLVFLAFKYFLKVFFIFFKCLICLKSSSNVVQKETQKWAQSMTPTSCADPLYNQVADGFYSPHNSTEHRDIYTHKLICMMMDHISM